MSKPKELNLNKKVQKQILSYFNGGRGKEQTKDAKKIATKVDVPYRQVMLFLEQTGLRSYSETSY